MPPRPLRPCKQCRKLTRNANGYCDAHSHIYEEKRNKARKDHDKKRGTRTQRGYGNKWLCIRAQFLRLNPLCARCNEHGVVKQANCVHHLDHNQHNNKHENLQSLCHDCHEIIHGRKRG